MSDCGRGCALDAGPYRKKVYPPDPGMKPTVYIETSVVSYVTARRSRDLVVAAHQEITQEWWETALPSFSGYVSPIVLEETSRGDARAAHKRLDLIAGLPVLEVLPEVRELADAYFRATAIPEKARGDSYHLALAAWHGMDFLVSWNCTHIVSGRVRRAVDDINLELGIRTSVICTPEELMEA